MATNGNPPKRHFNEDILGFLHALSRLSLSYPFCNSKFVRCNSWGRSDFVTRSDKKNGFQISDREKLGMNIAPLRCGICRNIYTVECIYIYCIYIYMFVHRHLPNSLRMHWLFVLGCCTLSPSILSVEIGWKVAILERNNTF